MKKHVLLTGRPGIGKTTAIRKAIQYIGIERVGGFWSSEMKRDGRRVGFGIHTVEGEDGILAHVDRNHGPLVSKYRVNVADINRVAIPALERARKCGKIIIIDEIAKMELYSEGFKQEVLKCLNEGRVLGTIQQWSSSFLNQVRNRSDVRMVEVTTANRDELPAQIASWFQQ
ncbi:MAG: nucleoside-triphosphatase [Candidatus Thorarchaeota archaeon]